MTEKPKSGGWLYGALMVILVWTSLDLAHTLGRLQGWREAIQTTRAYNAGMARALEEIRRYRP